MKASYLTLEIEIFSLFILFSTIKIPKNSLVNRFYSFRVCLFVCNSCTSYIYSGLVVKKGRLGMKAVNFLAAFPFLSN
jgi:hypothetical protein